ncbi:MAG: gliding motility-associated C-terminal domain-containing protein, partial [Saprospiraceae bacterium]|nr:gliding motility-associated C-terminal domain-containing protein [Saprospiraceae bacterium]
GYSDYITIFTDDSELKVIHFQIADRWGDLCYRRDNFSPQYASDGWDGRWRGQPAPAGVYAWFALVEFSDGEQLLLEGDLTLVR